MTKEEEIKLVEEAKTNIQSFTRLYDEYFDQIYLFVLKRVGVVEYAQDVTSFVFLKAIEQIQSFDTTKGYRLRPWLYRIAYNRIVDEFRKKSKIDNSKDIDTQASDSQTDKDVNDYYIQKEVRLILGRINKRYREILYLKYFSELELEEIADVLQEKKSNVSVLLHRALESFRKEYEKIFAKSEIF
jgi:RNA polymerase sigma-70 factor (ECF subfamily)